MQGVVLAQAGIRLAKELEAPMASWDVPGPGLFFLSWGVWGTQVQEVRGPVSAEQTAS